MKFLSFHNDYYCASLRVFCKSSGHGTNKQKPTTCTTKAKAHVFVFKFAVQVKNIEEKKQLSGI
jgi:hypothetical protein